MINVRGDFLHRGGFGRSNVQVVKKPVATPIVMHVKVHVVPIPVDAQTFLVYSTNYFTLCLPLA